jgi:hypothetical protein
MPSLGERLEQYTLKHPQEVLLVTAEIEGEPDQITIFKGFSSSLVRPTAFDPDIPVLPATARVLTIDRLRSPYDARSPQYIEQNLSAETMEVRLRAMGL